MSAQLPFNFVSLPIPLLKQQPTVTQPIYGKVMPSHSKLRCRIAFATYEARLDGNSALKMETENSPHDTKNSMSASGTHRRSVKREHRGDGNEIADPAKVSRAAALLQTPYVITRDEDGKVISRTGVTGGALGPVQRFAPAVQSYISPFRFEL